jgi:hypothetical protein
MACATKAFSYQDVKTILETLPTAVTPEPLLPHENIRGNSYYQ